MKKKLLVVSLALILTVAAFAAIQAGEWSVFVSEGEQGTVEVVGGGSTVIGGGDVLTGGENTTTIITVTPGPDSGAAVITGPDGKQVEPVVEEQPKTEIPPVKESEKPVRKLANNYQPSIPRVAKTDGTTVYLRPVAGCEYSLGGEVWQDEPVFSGLHLDVEYLVYQRFKETETTLASMPSDPLSVLFKTEPVKEPEPIVDLEVPEDVVSEPIRPVNVDAERIIDLDGKQVWLGMTTKELFNNLGAENLTDVLPAMWNGLTWHVFKGDGELFVAGVGTDGTVQSMYAVGKQWKWNGVQSYTKYDKMPELTRTGKKVLRAALFDEPGKVRMPYAIRLNIALAHGSLSFDQVNLESESKLVMYLTNTYRELNGLKPQEWCDTAELVATEHSVNMAEKNFFSHMDQNRRLVVNRLNRKGIIPYTCAENIAGGQTDAFEAFTDWVNSPGHRKNILLPKPVKTGVGCATCVGSDYFIYWTQVFYLA